MKKNMSASGKPKKARWTTSQKAEARRAATDRQRAPRGEGSPRREGERLVKPRRQVDGGRPQDGERRYDKPRRDFSDRPRRDFNDRPRRDYDDRPRRDFADRDNRGDRGGYDRPRRDFSDRPRRDFNDRPRRDYDDRPRCDFGDRDNRGDRGGYDRPRRDFNDRPRRDYDDRPRRDVGDRDNRGDRGGYDRPRRDYDKPRRDFNDRPRRDYDDRPRRDFKDRPRRSFDERPRRDDAPLHVDPDTSRAVPVTDDNGFKALGLPMPLVERLAQDGITEPFPIQSATIPDALAGKDVLGRGQTGSGKTLSFGLPTITRLAGSNAAPGQVRAVILVPTRELAMQVSDALAPLVHVMGLRHKLVAGGMPYPPQIEALARGLDVLVATPGRLRDLIERGAADLSNVEVAILDEADHMAEMGFLEEITEILDLVPAGGQRLLFSATLDRGIDKVVDRYLVDPVTHSTDPDTASVATMEHHVLLIDPMHKKVITAEVANRTGRTVVFVRTKLGADRVALQLREQGVMAVALHGGLNQSQRNRVLAAFKAGTVPVLVATDVAARGIHVDDVSVVLQVDPPADHKDYLHRSGRTARAGEQGTVVTLALPHQKRQMERLVAEAGVDVTAVRTAPGDPVLYDGVGARTPSGEPVLESAYRRIVDGEPRVRRGAPRRGGPGYGHHGRPNDRVFRKGRRD